MGKSAVSEDSERSRDVLAMSGTGQPLAIFYPRGPTRSGNYPVRVLSLRCPLVRGQMSGASVILSFWNLGWRLGLLSFSLPSLSLSIYSWGREEILGQPKDRGSNTGAADSKLGLT